VCVYVCLFACSCDLPSNKMYPGRRCTELRVQTFINPRPSGVFFVAHVYIVKIV